MTKKGKTFRSPFCVIIFSMFAYFILYSICFWWFDDKDRFIQTIHKTTQKSVHRYYTHINSNIYAQYTHTYTQLYLNLPLLFKILISWENIPLWERPSGCVIRISTSPQVGLPRLKEPQVTTIKLVSICWQPSRT